MTQYTYAPDPPESSLSASITSTDTSMEVDTIPSGVSAGDEVKCIIEQDHPHEVVIGEVGTIGAGANGGTDITGLARGESGTSEVSHSSGAVVIVGAGDRDEMATRIPPWDPGLAGLQLTPIGQEAGGSRDNFGGRIHFIAIHVPVTFTFTQATIDIQTAGTESSAGSGINRIVCYSIFPSGAPKNKLGSWDVDATTTGVKTATINLTLTPGLYSWGVWQTGWSAGPEWRTNSKMYIPSTGNTQGFNKRWYRTENEYTDPLPSSLEGEPITNDTGPLITIS